MDRKADISNIIISCLRDMMSLRDKEFKGEWQDFDNDAGNVIRIEALMCFLLALSTLKSRENEIYDIFPQNKLKAECENIIMDDETLNFYGTPYIDVVDVDGNKHGFIDAACFTLSLVFHYHKLWGINPNDKPIYQEVFCKALEFIDGCIVEQKGETMGFQFTNYGIREEPANYTTWMVLDKLEDVLPIENENDFVNKDALQLIKKLRADAGLILKRFEETYVEGQPLVLDSKEYNMSITNGVVAYDDNDEYIHYNLWIILALLFLNSQKGYKLREALLFVENEHQKNPKAYQAVTQKGWDYYFENDKIKGEANLNSFSGRAFLAQYLKSIVLFYRNFPDYKKDNKPNLDDAYQMLLQNRFGVKNKTMNYWDAHSRSGYSLTYTEGAIDVLCSYYKYLPDTVEMETPPGQLLEKSKILNDIRKSVSEMQKSLKNIENNLDSQSKPHDISQDLEELKQTFTAALKVGKGKK